MPQSRRRPPGKNGPTPTRRAAPPRGSWPGQPVRPPATGLRAAVEQRSAVPLTYLSQRPPWTLPLLTAVLLLAGLFSPPPLGLPLLVLVLLLVGWLSYLSWPVVEGRGRLLRLAMLGLLLVALVQRAV